MSKLHPKTLRQSSVERYLIHVLCRSCRALRRINASRTWSGTVAWSREFKKLWVQTGHPRVRLHFMSAKPKFPKLTLTELLASSTSPATCVRIPITSRYSATRAGYHASPCLSSQPKPRHSPLHVFRRLFSDHEITTHNVRKGIRKKMRLVRHYVFCLLYTSPSPRD